MLPHLKKENNAEPEKFVSVDQEMANIHQDRHPMTPARDMANPALDKEPEDGKEATD